MRRFNFKIPDRLKRLLPIISGLAIVFLTYLYGTEIGAFVGFPKGYDGMGHMSLARILRDSWPFIYWNSYWDSGTTLLIRSYPPMTYLLSALMSRLFSWPLEKVFILLTTISFLVITLGVFVFVFLLTKKNIPALLTSLLVISSPSFWAYVIEGGLYPRVFGAAALVSAWVFVWLCLREEKGERVKKVNLWYLLAVLALFMTMTFHVLSAFWLFSSVVLMAYVWTKTKLELITKVLYLFVPAVLLAAFYYIPLVFLPGKTTPPFGRFPAEAAYRPVSLARLFRPETTVTAVPVLLIPLVLVSIFLRFGSEIKKEDHLRVIKISKALIAFSVFSLAYALGLLGGYLYGVHPHHFLFYFVLFLSVFVGLSFGLVQRITPVERILLIALCGSIIISWQKQVPNLKEGAVDYSKVHQQSFQSLQVDPNEKNYRFGNANEVIAGWFNWKHLIPQTRDYQYYGPLYIDWEYFLEVTVWGKGENYQETNFLLDWFGVKNFYVTAAGRGIQAVSGGKFDQRPEYKAVANNQFEYLQATPILAATNAPTMAVVADQYSYEVLIRNLAMGSLDSQTLIPAKIGERVSDLLREDLDQFDLVFLYGFRGSLGGRAAFKLAEYVKKGGQLFIEGGKEMMGELPDPWPVKRIMSESLGEDWQFRVEESALPTKIDFSQFSSPDVDGDGWGVGTGAEMKDWARPVLFSGNQPVVVMGQLGQGKVIWSGLNLPYHLNRTENTEEYAFFKNLIFSLLDEAEGEPVEFEASFIHNQKREIEVKQKAKGILFKESYFPNWQAYIQTSNIKHQTSNKIRIYPAGPMMMYVPLSNEEFPLKVVLSYQVSFIEKAGLVISFVSFGLLIIFLLRSLKQELIYRLKLVLDKQKKLVLE